MRLKRTAGIALLIAAAALVWVTRGGTRWPALYYMTGSSMEPAVRPREIFLTWSPAEPIARGDLVIFEFSDEDGDFHVLRRLAGLPGDTLIMTEGALVVNGRATAWPFRVLEPRARTSPYARVGDLYTWGPWVVPADSVFLLSDTRDHLGWPDSRFIGAVPRSRVIARATRALSGRRLAPFQPLTPR
jgi:signal peptidase I